MKSGIKIGLFAWISIIMIACNQNSLDVDVSEITVDSKAKRFEHDLFTSFKETKGEVAALRKEYGGFTDVFVHRILNIPEGHDTSINAQLSLFVNDSEVRDIYRLADSAYKNVDDLNQGMEGFLKHLQYYFPEKKVPVVVTYISAFNYAVITTDSVIGIGLDMFLGPDVMYYPQLGIPKYMFVKFRSEYIVPSAVKAWFQSEYDLQAVKNDLISQLIYQGKLLYYSKAMLPQVNDTLLTGYSDEQLKWCRENEANVWSFFIENKLLFNTDPSLYAKFVNEGPSTSGFPKEAPGKIGAWIGWQIVAKYAEKKNDITLSQLMLETDAQKILEQSGYKPKK